MRRTRLPSLLVSVALAACAGDRTPTAPPPATPPTDGARASTAPARPPWMPSRTLNFDYVGVGRAAAATATTAPRAQSPCSDAGSGHHEFALRIPPASFALMRADSIRVFWSYKERHYRPKGGTTNLQAVADLFLNGAATGPSRVHTSRDSSAQPDSIVRVFVSVAPPMLDRLGLEGGTLRVLVNSMATVSLPPELCRQEVAGVHAKITMSTTPQLHVFE